MTGRWLRRRLAALAVTLPWLAVAPAPAQPPAAVCPPAVVSTGAADGAPRDRGLLWRITRDGRSSYLYGTLHVGKPAWQRLGPQVTAALRASDALALEVDPGDPALLQALTGLPRGTALPAPLNDRLQHAFERACVAPASLAPLHPVLQTTTLAVLEARWLGMDPAFALEQMLAEQARAGGLRVVALETAAQQTGALLPASDAETQALIDQTLRQLEDRSARRCWRAWPRPGRAATWRRWRTTSTGATASPATAIAPTCAGPTTAATRRWPTASKPGIARAGASLPRWGRCT